MQGMGSMAAAMIEVAKIKSSHGRDESSLTPLLANINQQLEEQSRMNQEQSAINQAILHTLQQLKK